MRYLPLLLIALIFSTFGCSDNESVNHNVPVFSVTGKITGPADSTLLIARRWSNDSVAIDYVRVDSGVFIYQGVTDSLMELNVMFDNGLNVPSVYVSPNSELVIDYDLLSKNVNVGGDTLNSFLYSDIADTIKNFGKSAIINYINNNINKPVAIVFLKETLPLFDNENDIKTLLSKIPAENKPHFLVNDINNYINKNWSLKIGQKIPYMGMSDTEAKRFNFFENNNYVVLVSFWATYDEDSMERMEEVVKLSKKYQSKHLRFVNISLDTDDELWKKTVDKKKYPGRNARYLRGFSDDLVGKARLLNLPHNLVLDTLQYVRAIDLYGKDLAPFIDKQLPKKVVKK